ncbi:glycosyltransferase family 4 protein [Bacteroides sp.]
MKIAFDAKRAAQNRTGLGNYSRFVIEGLSRYYPENEYLLYTPSPQKARLFGSLAERENCTIRYPESFIWKRFPSLWRISGIRKQIKDDQPAIFHGLSNELPLGIEHLKGTKSIVTIHDLIFLRYPEFYTGIDRNIYTYKFHRACQKADCIIAVSECTKRDIIHYFGIPADKIKVIYQGCDESFRHQADQMLKEEAQKRYRLPEKYLLYVGSIESRKNLLLIAKALTKTNCKLPLVAVGKHTPYADKVRQYADQHGLSDRIIMLHDVSFRYFPAIYQMASLFIYPSFFEGFGIPLLEALNSRVPAIGATGSCLEEAGGPDSIYVHPEDDEGLASAIDHVINDTSLQKEMTNRGIEYAARFEQATLSKQTIELYRSLL